MQVEGSILGIGKIFICINILGPGIPGILVNKFGWIPGNLGIPVVKYIIILTRILLYSETTYKKNYYRIPEIPVGFRKFRNFRNRWGSVMYSPSGIWPNLVEPNQTWNIA